MSNPDYCRVCGTPLKAGSQFCPKCGKVVTAVSYSQSTNQYDGSSGPSQARAGAPATSDKIWGIDKRYVVVALLFLVLVLPIVPRQKVVEVIENEMVTVTSMSTSFMTTYATQQLGQGTTTIQVYVGYVNSFNSGNTIVDPSDHVIRVDYVNEPGGTYSVTLYTYEGQQMVFRAVYGYDLTRTGTAQVQGQGQVLITPVVTPVPTPMQNVQQQQVKHSNVITEHVSILQILLGY
jgi:uncharacterized Zn finger protein (UPF0148 family)